MRLSASLCSLTLITVFVFLLLLFFEEDLRFVDVDLLLDLRLAEVDRDLVLLTVGDFFLLVLLDPFLPPTSPLPDKSIVSTFFARSFNEALASLNF